MLYGSGGDERGLVQDERRDEGGLVRDRDGGDEGGLVRDVGGLSSSSIVWLLFVPVLIVNEGWLVSGIFDGTTLLVVEVIGAVSISGGPWLQNHISLDKKNYMSYLLDSVEMERDSPLKDGEPSSLKTLALCWQASC